VVAAASKPADPKPTEVSAKATRRVFSAAYKHQILAEADGCTKPGQIGALLRREGLYRSHLTDWRLARRRGTLGKTKRGPKVGAPDERERRITQLEQEVQKQKARADRAEALVELQKKVAELFALRIGEPSEKRK
jgi:transposase